MGLKWVADKFEGLETDIRERDNNLQHTLRDMIGELQNDIHSMNRDFVKKLGEMDEKFERRFREMDRTVDNGFLRLDDKFGKGFGDLKWETIALKDRVGNLEERVTTLSGKVDGLDNTVKRLEEDLRQDSKKHQRRYSRLSRRIVVITTELTRGTYEFEFDDDNDSDDSEESPPPPGHTAQNTSTNVTSPIAGPSTATQATPKTGLRSQRSIVSFGKLKIRNLSLPNLSKKR